MAESIVPLSIVHIVLLVIVQPFFALLLVSFFKLNKVAWFKILMFFWYFVTPFVGIAQICLTTFFPIVRIFSTRFYNMAGLYVCSCGIIDCIQLTNAVTDAGRSGVEDTNKRYATILAGCYGVATAFSFAMIFIAPDDLTVVRVVTIVTMFAEAAMSVRCLRTIQSVLADGPASTGKKTGGSRLAQYYLATTAHRCGQGVGITLACLGMPTTAICTVHLITTTSLVTVLWSLRKNLMIQLGVEDTSKKSTKSKKSKSVDPSAVGASSVASTAGSSADSSASSKVQVAPKS